jgi:DNA-directed RNA polymerase specialized sigma24 family protein
MFESKGNASVSQEAWGRIADVTLGFLLNRRVPREDAENIASEALCIALEKYDPQYWQQRGDSSIDSEEAMRRLVVMVADHKTRAFWREKKRDQKYLRPLEEGEDLSDFTAPGADIPDRILQEKQNGEWLKKHLEALPFKDRLVLDLWSRKYSYDHIASHLRTTVPAVKSRLNKAWKKLRSQADIASHIES